jgi:hypothetical protein
VVGTSSWGFSKRKRVCKFVTVGVVVRRDDGRRMAEKGNDSDWWNSDVVVLLLGRRQNGDMVEW